MTPTHYEETANTILDHISQITKARKTNSAETIGTIVRDRVRWIRNRHSFYNENLGARRSTRED